MRSNKFLLFIILFLLLALTASLYLVLKNTSLFTRASTTSNQDIALQNSYLFASPIQAKAGGEEKVRVTVFILDTQGLGISSKTVALEASGGVTITPLSPVTDDTGKATFDLSSIAPGRARLSATVDGAKVPQTVSVIFY